MNDTRNAAEPQAWVGCLACYNAGRLVGEWFDGVEAGEVTPEQIHRDPAAADMAAREYAHEELWVFDHGGYGGLIPGECSPAEAQKLAELLAEVEDTDAFIAYAEYVGTEYADVEGFHEAYAGEWESIGDYAYAYVEDTGMLDGIPEMVARYFDYDSFAHDMDCGGDIYTVPAGNGSVYVFRTL